MSRKLEFGRLSTQTLCRNLFYLGCLPLLRPVVSLAVVVAQVYPYHRNVKLPDDMYTSVPEPNFFLGAAVAIVLFVILAALWWHLCEILFNLVEYLQQGAARNTSKAPAVEMQSACTLECYPTDTTETIW